MSRHRIRPLPAASADISGCLVHRPPPALFLLRPWPSPSPVIPKFWSSLLNRKQKPERASLLRFALHPNLAAVRLHQPFRDRQSQTHTRGVAVHAHKILENFLVVFWRNPGARIRHADLHAVGPRQPESTPLLAGC